MKEELFKECPICKSTNQPVATTCYFCLEPLSEQIEPPDPHESYVQMMLRNWREHG